jgi:hypothetical protein
MRRIEAPEFIDRRNLVFGVAPGGTIEAVIDAGDIVYELYSPFVVAVDQAAARVTLARRPQGAISLLVRRTPTCLIQARWHPPSPDRPPGESDEVRAPERRG